MYVGPHLCSDRRVVLWFPFDLIGEAPEEAVAISCHKLDFAPDLLHLMGLHRAQHQPDAEFQNES